MNVHPSSRWVVANTIGFGLGGAVFGAFMRTANQPYYEVVTSASDAVRIESVSTGEGMALFGALIGVVQWVVLRRTPFGRQWAPLTLIAWAIMGVIVGTLSGLGLGQLSSIGPHRDGPVVLAVVIPGILVFGLPSTLQWLVMRRHVAADRWPLVGFAGLIMGFVAAGVVVRWGLVDVVAWLTPYDFPSAKALICAGAVIGTTYGIVTGPTIGQIMRHANRPTTSQARTAQPGRPGRQR